MSGKSPPVNPNKGSAVYHGHRKSIAVTYTNTANKLAVPGFGRRRSSEARLDYSDEEQCSVNSRRILDHTKGGKSNISVRLFLVFKLIIYFLNLGVIAIRS